MVISKAKKTLLVVLTLALTVSLAAWGVVVLLRKDAGRLRIYEQEALVVGLERLREECRKEGLASGICDEIEGWVSDSECFGRTCWLIYARTPQQQTPGFGGSVTVVKQDGKYMVTDYLRNTGIE